MAFDGTHKTEKQWPVIQSLSKDHPTSDKAKKGTTPSSKIVVNQLIIQAVSGLSIGYWTDYQMLQIE